MDQPKKIYRKTALKNMVENDLQHQKIEALKAAVHEVREAASSGDVSRFFQHNEALIGHKLLAKKQPALAHKLIHAYLAILEEIRKYPQSEYQLWLKKFFRQLSTFTDLPQANAFPKLFLVLHEERNQWKDYPNLVEFWGWEHVTAAFLSGEDENPDLVAEVFQTYTAWIIEQKKQFFAKKFYPKWEAFIHFLDQLIENQPKVSGLRFAMADLLLHKGNHLTAAKRLGLILPYIEDFPHLLGSWERIAQVYHKSQEEKALALFKAYMLCEESKAKRRFFMELIPVLIGNSKLEAAKTLLLHAEEKQFFKLPSQIKSCFQSEWFSKTTENDFSLVAAELETDAEALLEAPAIYPAYAVLTYINKDKKLANFIIEEGVSGFFYYGLLEEARTPKVGEVIKVRFIEKDENAYYQAFSFYYISGEERLRSAAVKSFSGLLIKPMGHQNGFANDVFIPPNLISEHALKSKTVISGIAMLSKNKRDEWSWKAFEITGVRESKKYGPNAKQEEQP